MAFKHAIVLLTILTFTLPIATHANAPAKSHRNVTNNHEGSFCGDAVPSCRLQEEPNCRTKDCQHMITPLIFPFLALFVGCLLQGVTKLLRLPFTLLLLFAGVVLGILGCAVDMGLLTVSLQRWVHLHPPDIFFYIFLAPLIFEAAFNTQWHIFKRLLLPILIAAFVIVLAQTGLIAAFTHAVVQGEPDWGVWPALMFGAMLSATDPISVTATLKALGASENLGTLIEGESLVNDGSAFVLWEAFFKNSMHDAGEKEVLSVKEIAFQVIHKSVGGMLLGVLFALITLAILTFLYDEFEIETSLTVVVAFLGFWTAQSPAKLSGVISNVASGLMLSAFGRPLISKSVRHSLAEFWELLGWIANTIVFVHSGVLTVAFVWPCSSHHMQAKDYLLIFAFFAYLQVIRVVLFGLAYPLLAWRNKWFTWREDLVVGMSGLRGAVSLILALNIAGADAIKVNVRSHIVLWTTGIVSLSLVINGLLVPRLMSILKMDGPDKTRATFLRRARATMVQATLSTLDTLCVDIGYKTARWSYVLENVLPRAWLDEEDTGKDYAKAAAEIWDNNRTDRVSLGFVHTEQYRAAALGRRSTEIIRASMIDSEPNRMSLSKPVRGTKDFKMEPLHLKRISEYSEVVEPISLGFRSSTDFDRHRYYSMIQEPNNIYGFEEQDAASDDYAFSVPGEVNDYKSCDKEVRRRMLTGMLSHVRALSNATLIEYSALVGLEEEIQSALDANEEDIQDYDLFSRLNRDTVFARLFSKCIDPKKFSGESIARASAVFSILTEILKQDILSQSRTVQMEAEQLHDGAAFRLTELEMLNPKGFRWVQSQLAIHMTVARQDATLSDLRGSGVIDAFEYNVLHNDLLAIRRRHAVHARRMWKKQTLGPRKLLPYHPMFADCNTAALPELRRMPVVNLLPGHHLSLEKGTLTMVLQGALRPIESPIRKSVPVSKMNREFRNSYREQRYNSSRSVPWNNDDGDMEHYIREPEKTYEVPQDPVKPCDHSKHHWCFSAFSGFCGPALACSINNVPLGEECHVAHEKLRQAEFMACDIAETTAVFCMPARHVRRMSRQYKSFRDEMTRSLARQLVLDSIADQKTYHLRRVGEALNNTLDAQTIIGRAFRILERLPYMSVVRLHKGKMTEAEKFKKGPMQVTVQGPGMLINGIVRVSTVDTSGLEGAQNLLHERLEGPALLPAGGLIIEAVLDSKEPVQDTSTAIEEADSHWSAEGAFGPVLAHILVEEQQNLDAWASARLRRWTADPNTVDMNGRFGMFRHFTSSMYSDIESEYEYSASQVGDLDFL